MANKGDVDLVIRAKNEASKNLETVARALTALADTQADVSSSAGKAGNALSELGRMSAAVAAAYAKLTSDTDRAAAAFQRNDAALNENRALHQALTAQLTAAAGVQARLRAEVEQAANSTAEDKARKKELAAQLKLVDRAYNSLSSQVERTGRRIEQQEAVTRQSFYAFQEMAGGAAQAQAALQRVEAAQKEAAAAATASAAEQAAAAAKAEQAQVQAARRTALELKRSMTEAAETARAAWQQAQQQIATAVAGFGGKGPQTSDDVAKLAELQSVARANKAAYNELQVAVEQYTRALRDENATQAQVAAAQQRARAAMAGANAMMVQQASAARQAASGARDLGNAHGEAKNKTENLNKSLQSLFANSRRSLSLYQRLRGEVLSLAATYGGLYAAINGVRNIIDTGMSMQAIESRLNVVTGGDMQKTAAEMQWVISEADRLGFSLNVLAQEWSKFAVSAEASNFTMGQTRKIFTSVAEAGRVLKLGSDQIERSYVALTQMMSKGTIQMEELRQQLGEHIPGAFAIMAKALGVTGAELTDMMEKGQLTSDYLIAFADELDSRFGGQLPNALKLTQAEMGRFSTAVTLALDKIGKAGVLDTFTEALRDLQEMLRSPEAEVWFDRLGAGISAVIKLLMALLENLDYVMVALAAIGTVRGVAYLIKLRAAIISATTAMAGATLAARGMSVAMSAMGGPIGIILGLAVTAFGALATRVSESEKSMKSAAKTVDEITSAYRRGVKSAEDWAEAMKDLSALQIDRDLKNLKANLADALDDIYQPFGRMLMARAKLFNTPISAAVQEMHALAEGAKNGSIPLDEFKKRLDAIAQANPNLKEVALEMQDSAAEAIKAKDALDRFEASLRLQAGTATEADKKLLGVAEATEALADAQAAGKKAMDSYTGAMDRLAKMIPQLKEKLEFEAKLESVKQTLADAYKGVDDALKNGTINEDQAARLRQDAQDRANRAMDAVRKGYEDGIIKAMSLDSKSIEARIIQIESGGVATAKANTSSALGPAQFTAGTWLRLFDRVFPELADLTKEAKLAMRTQVEASQKMLHVLTQENQGALVQAGITPNAANTYLAHFLGSGDAIKVILANPDELAKNIVNPASVEANKSILGKGQTAGDLIAWATQKMGGGAPLQSSGWTKGETDEAQARQKHLDDVRKINEELDKREGLIGKTELAAAIYNETTAKGIDLQSKDGQEIAAKVTRIWNAEQAAKAHETAEKRVNDLLALRKELQDQLELAQSTGDLGMAAQLQQQIDGLNVSLAEAIQKAIELWEAFGGPGSDLAIAKLTTLQASLQRSNEITLDAKTLAQSFANGATNAFMKVGDAIGAWIDGTMKGKDAIEAIGNAFRQFAADFLREIAQMILKQLFFNMISGFLGGLGGGGLTGIATVPFHTGGVVGRDGQAPRMFAPAWFANAVRYHSGGIAGLKPNEVPAVLERGEEVLTKNDPRHAANLGQPGQEGAGQQPANVRIVNAIDAGGMLDAALNTREGEQTIMNFIKANRSAVKSAIG